MDKKNINQPVYYMKDGHKHTLRQKFLVFIGEDYNYEFTQCWRCPQCGAFNDARMTRCGRGHKEWTLGN